MGREARVRKREVRMEGGMVEGVCLEDGGSCRGREEEETEREKEKSRRKGKERNADQPGMRGRSDDSAGDYRAGLQMYPGLSDCWIN